MMSRIAIAVVAVASAAAGVDGSAALRGNSSARRLSAGLGLGGRFVLAHRYNLAASPAEEFDVVTVPDQNLTHSCSNYIDDGSTVFTRDGKLVLKVASACDGGGCLNSGRIMSKRAYKYGIFTFSAKVPKCNGVWPALWLLPGNTNGTGAYGDWPCSGEIDVLETVDKQSVGAFNLVAGYGAGGPSGCGAPLSCNKCGNHGDYCTSTTMKNLKESFYEVEETKCDGPNPSWREHLFVLNWQPDKLAVYVDPELRYDAGGTSSTSCRRRSAAGAPTRWMPMRTPPSRSTPTPTRPPGEPWRPSWRPATPSRRRWARPSTSR